MERKQGELEKLMCEIATLRTENHFMKGLLSEIKLSVKSAINSNEKPVVDEILGNIVTRLEKNGIKDLFNLNFDL